MKWQDSLRISLALVALVAVYVISGEKASADYVFGKAVNLGPIVNSQYPDGWWGGSISADGLSLYFDSQRPGGLGEDDLWVTTRVTVSDPWGPPVNLGGTVNSAALDGCPSISADGLELYFHSMRPGGSGGFHGGDLWVTTRTTLSSPWGKPVWLGPILNTRDDDVSPCISADGLSLFFGSGRLSATGGIWNTWMSTRPTQQSAWGPPVNLGIAGSEFNPSLSADGRLLFFTRGDPGPAPLLDIWVTTRASTNDTWGEPIDLGPNVNSPQADWPIGVLADGSLLYFASNRPGGAGADDLWQASILPVVDFNRDGKVNAAEITLLVANWGKNTPLCDIGPFPWGDGLVDEADLRVVMESLMTPGPQASDVLCDVILSWTSPSSAPTQDVYFGTSFDAVNTASRANPQGTLVSQGQTATTYDPAGLLEFSRTYYWRVDFVSSGPAPIIYKGPVLKFTTAALVYPIKNITAKASSGSPGSGPERTVDGSGLDKNDGHSTDGKDMWLSTAVPPHWIQYEFDKVYALHELWVWNSNQPVEPFVGFGAKSVKIEYSTDGATWAPLANVPEFARGTGKAGYAANTIVSFAGVPAKFVKLTIEKNWGVAPRTGLSEVRFFCIQSAAVPKP